MDSVLYAEKAIATLAFNQAKSTWIQKIRERTNTETSLLNNEVQLNQISKQMTDLTLENLKQISTLELAAKNSRKELIANVSKWKDTYLFVAPNSGQVAYLNFIENEKHVEVGTSVVSIIRLNVGINAHAELPLNGSGKVKNGQNVFIRLKNYPFEQFGVIPGKISSISLIPSKGKYSVFIELPNGLNTSQKFILPFKQELAGTTEIITDDLRLLERFFAGFRRVLNIDAF